MGKLMINNTVKKLTVKNSVLKFRLDHLLKKHYEVNNSSSCAGLSAIMIRRRKFIKRTESSSKHELEAQTVAIWSDGVCYLLMSWAMRWRLKLY